MLDFFTGGGIVEIMDEILRLGLKFVAIVDGYYEFSLCYREDGLDVGDFQLPASLQTMALPQHFDEGDFIGTWEVPEDITLAYGEALPYSSNAGLQTEGFAWWTVPDEIVWVEMRIFYAPDDGELLLPVDINTLGLYAHLYGGWLIFCPTGPVWLSGGSAKYATYTMVRRYTSGPKHVDPTWIFAYDETHPSKDYLIPAYYTVVDRPSQIEFVNPKVWYHTSFSQSLNRANDYKVAPVGPVLGYNFQDFYRDKVYVGFPGNDNPLVIINPDMLNHPIKQKRYRKLVSEGLAGEGDFWGDFWDFFGSTDKSYLSDGKGQVLEDSAGGKLYE